MWETGIFWVFKYSNNAYNDPKVEAETPTPIALNLNFFCILANSSLHILMASCTYSSVFATISGLPATALSRLLAAILTPLAANIVLWWIY